MAGSPEPTAAGFDAQAALERARAHADARKHKRYRPSKIDRYKGEIVRLVELGATPTVVQIHLADAHGLELSLSAVSRWMKKNEKA